MRFCCERRRVSSICSLPARAMNSSVGDAPAPGAPGQCGQEPRTSLKATASQGRVPAGRHELRIPPERRPRDLAYLARGRSSPCASLSAGLWLRSGPSVCHTARTRPNKTNRGSGQAGIAVQARPGGAKHGNSSVQAQRITGEPIGPRPSSPRRQATAGSPLSPAAPRRTSPPPGAHPRRGSC